MGQGTLQNVSGNERKSNNVDSGKGVKRRRKKTRDCGLLKKKNQKKIMDPMVPPTEPYSYFTGELMRISTFNCARLVHWLHANVFHLLTVSLYTSIILNV